MADSFSEISPHKEVGEFVEFPKWKYKERKHVLGKTAKIVNNAEEEKALGEGWFDSPTDCPNREAEQAEIQRSYWQRFEAADGNPNKQARILIEYRIQHPKEAAADSWYKERAPLISALQTQAALELAAERQLEDQGRRAIEAERTSGPRLQSGSKNPLKNLIMKLYLENPTRSQEDICSKLDTAMEKNPKVVPLGQWQKESGQKTWSHNLRHAKTKNRVKTYLSKIKADALKLLANRS